MPRPESPLASFRHGLNTAQFVVAEHPFGKELMFLINGSVLWSFVCRSPEELQEHFGAATAGLRANAWVEVDEVSATLDDTSKTDTAGASGRLFRVASKRSK